MNTIWVLPSHGRVLCEKFRSVYLLKGVWSSKIACSKICYSLIFSVVELKISYNLRVHFKTNSKVKPSTPISRRKYSSYFFEVTIENVSKTPLGFKEVATLARFIFESNPRGLQFWLFGCSSESFVGESLVRCQ